MNVKKVSFEAQIQSLEEIVAKLEKGELSLDDSLSHFEEGVKLTRECQKTLDKAQQKVEILTKGSGELASFNSDEL